VKIAGKFLQSRPLIVGQAILAAPLVISKPNKTSLMMIDVKQITALHRTTTQLWHQQEIANPHRDLLYVVCEQHKFNYLLWHEEDIARSRDVGDQKIAAVKRAIDGYNQKRNDAIEKIDDYLKQQLDGRGIVPAEIAKLNTETPGQAIDRLSILALRIYHMDEQLERPDVDQAHLASVRGKLEILHTQHDDLSASLQELLTDIFAGRKRLKLYRQFKMYNDPTLNPYLYQTPLRKAG
jgi:hypothetical protein